MSIDVRPANKYAVSKAFCVVKKKSAICGGVKNLVGGEGSGIEVEKKRIGMGRGGGSSCVVGEQSFEKVKRYSNLKERQLTTTQMFKRAFSIKKNSKSFSLNKGNKSLKELKEVSESDDEHTVKKETFMPPSMKRLKQCLSLVHSVGLMPTCSSSAASNLKTEIYNSRYSSKPSHVSTSVEIAKYELLEKQQFETDLKSTKNTLKKGRWVPWFADTTKSVNLKQVLKFIDHKNTIKKLAKDVIDTMTAEKDRTCAVVSEQRSLTAININQSNRSSFKSMISVIKRSIDKMSSFGIDKDQVGGCDNSCLILLSLLIDQCTERKQMNTSTLCELVRTAKSRNSWTTILG